MTPYTILVNAFRRANDGSGWNQREKKPEVVNRVVPAGGSILDRFIGV